MSHNTMRTPSGVLFRSNHETYDEGDSVEIETAEGVRIVLSAIDCRQFAHWLVQYDGSVKLKDLE